VPWHRVDVRRYHQRVLYIDIDVHHGDGVEEAFYTTDRVMSVSFHKFGDFFPGTGSAKDVGVKGGKYYSVNFPLNEGIDDLSYEHVFKPVIAKIMEVGAEWGGGEAAFKRCCRCAGTHARRCTAPAPWCCSAAPQDRLGCFNLTLKGHGECVRYVKSFGIPLLVLGGGGYTIRNVARCWAHETAVCLGEVLPDFIPPHDYVEYYKPDYRLHLEPSSEWRNVRGGWGLFMLHWSGKRAGHAFTLPARVAPQTVGSFVPPPPLRCGRHGEPEQPGVPG